MGRGKLTNNNDKKNGIDFAKYRRPNNFQDFCVNARNLLSDVSALWEDLLSHETMLSPGRTKGDSQQMPISSAIEWGDRGVTLHIVLRNVDALDRLEKGLASQMLALSHVSTNAL